MANVLNNNPAYRNALADLLYSSAPVTPLQNAGLSSGYGINTIDPTPQEMNLYQHHVYNMNQGKTKDNSSILQSVIGPIKGRYYNIPTVWDGQALGKDQFPLAVQKALAKGLDYWPSYSSPEEADKRYMEMHKFLDRDPPAMVKK